MSDFHSKPFLRSDLILSIFNYCWKRNFCPYLCFPRKKRYCLELIISGLNILDDFTLFLKFLP